VLLGSGQGSFVSSVLWAEGCAKLFVMQGTAAMGLILHLLQWAMSQYTSLSVPLQ
jgi:hypothetical protein